MIALINVNDMVFSGKAGSVISTVLSIATLVILILIKPYIIIQMIRNWNDRSAKITTVNKRI